MPGMDGFEAATAVRKLEAEARRLKSGHVSTADVWQADGTTPDDVSAEPGASNEEGPQGVPIVALTADVMVRRSY